MGKLQDFFLALNDMHCLASRFAVEIFSLQNISPTAGDYNVGWMHGKKEEK
jgi:hypothetical protein